MNLDLSKDEFKILKSEKLKIMEEKDPNYLEIVEVIDILDTDIPMGYFLERVNEVGYAQNAKDIREWIKTDKLIGVAFKGKSREEAIVEIYILSKKADNIHYKSSDTIKTNERLFKILYK